MENYKNRLIFNKYKARKLIFKSDLSEVYEGINVKKKEPVAIKFEKRKGDDLIVSESLFFV